MLINYINNLGIRHKLILFLIIPILIIVYFSVSNIYHRFGEQQEGKSSLEFILLSFKIDDVLHELQKERGISAGFLGSKGKLFREKLRLQRQLTDKKLKLFSLELAANAEKNNYWNLDEIFSRAKLNQQKLAGIRDEIDSLNSTEFFEGYSSLIASGLDIIRNQQVVTSNAIISRQSDAYTNLLLLQERAGQERGLLNGVFSSGTLDAKQFKLISSYISEQKSLIEKFYTVASQKQQILFIDKMNHRDVLDVEKLRDAVINKAIRNDRFNSLMGYIGYGGLIHDFKNYVIRGEQRYAKNFNTIYIDTIKIIKEYQLLPGISEKENDSLKIIKTTFDKYKSSLEKITQLIKKGNSIEKINFVVKVDDAPALQAISYLRKSITDLDTSIWWEKATIRIEYIRDVSNILRIDIASLAQKNLKTATLVLYIYFVLTIMTLIFLFVLVYWMSYRLINNILKLSEHMTKMHEQDEFENLIHIEGNDELSKLGESFNQLMSERIKSDEKRKIIQQQLLQSQKMESIGLLTGGVAHDFNNVLSVILGYTELALASENDKSRLNKYLNEIISAGDRAKDLVSRMLTFSRGSKDIEVQQLKIEPLLKDSLKMIRPLLPSTIELEINTTPNLPSVSLNPVMLHQIIMNLSINARDAIIEHGKIIYSLKPVSINNEICSSCYTWVTGDFIELSISDSGTGIKPENMNSLFEPFFTTKEMGSEKGTGLGLSMVHGIMHDHNGHILIESIQGEGSTFRLLFPLALNEGASSDEATKHDYVTEDINTSKNKGRNILLVDDDKSIVTMMHEALITYGFNVTSFSDSELALEYFRENENYFDLLITDQTMPKLTGAELSKVILEIQPDMSIIMCSGHSDVLDEEGALKIGIKAYVTKPVSNKELLNTISQLLS